MDFKLLMFAGVLSLVLGCHSQSPLIDAPSRVENTTAENTGKNTIEQLEIKGQGALDVGTSGRATSRMLLSDGPGIASLLNKNYNEDTTSCIDYESKTPRGYYFCTGVLLRTTDNGDFNPWEASPTALQLHATSFSWIRHDLNTAGFFKSAGFILLNPADILAEAVYGPEFPRFGITRNTFVKCVFPFDAWTTRTMNRNYDGCDLEGTGLGTPLMDQPWGSCDNRLGFTLASQWDKYFRDAGQINYKQCSWNADSTTGWEKMIASHNNFTGQSSWNEVLIYNWGPAGHESVTEGMRKWIVAFFYDPARANSLSIAQIFQRKMAATGKRVPVLRLDFAAAAAQRFQFRTEDQLLGVYP